MLDTVGRTSLLVPVASVSYLIVWFGGEAPSKVQFAFFTQAAAGRAINNAFAVFVTLLEEDRPFQWAYKDAIN